MDGLSYTTIIEFAEPLAGRRGSAFFVRPHHTFIIMTTPKCPKCNHPTFAFTEILPKGSKFKMYAVHCASCGAVMGIQPYYNTADALCRLAKKLGVSLDLDSD